jgi:hypothetical protein
MQLDSVSAELAKVHRVMPNTCGICGGHFLEFIRTKIRPSNNRPVPMYPGGYKGLQHTPRDIIKRLNDLSLRISNVDAQAAGRERTYKRTANWDTTLEISHKRYEAFHKASNGDVAGNSTQSTHIRCSLCCVPGTFHNCLLGACNQLGACCIHPFILVAVGNLSVLQGSSGLSPNEMQLCAVAPRTTKVGLNLNVAFKNKFNFDPVSLRKCDNGLIKKSLYLLIDSK